MLSLTDLRKADFTDAQLQGASLDLTQLQGANLFGAQLDGASLDAAQLQGASLNGAQLQDVRGKPNVDLADLRNIDATPTKLSEEEWPGGVQVLKRGRPIPALVQFSGMLPGPRNWRAKKVRGGEPSS